MIILFLVLTLIVGSLIGNLLNIILKDKISTTWSSIIHILLIFIFIEILFKTRYGKYILKKLKIK